MADPRTYLHELERTLDRARPGLSAGEQEEIAAAALDALFGVGVALADGSLTRAAAEPVVDRTRDRLALLGAGLAEVVENDPNPLAGELVYPDVYENRCVTRSGLQFAIDLYWGGSAPAELSEGIERFDHMLGQAAKGGASLNPEDVPAGVPREHWWWWAA